MKIPLLISGFVLVAFAVADITGWLQTSHSDPDNSDPHNSDAHDQESEHVSRVVWLLLLPVIAVMIATPAPLGGWGLNRQQTRDSNRNWSPLTVVPGVATVVPVPDFVGRSLEPGAPSVVGLRVELIGFVSGRTDSDFTIARYSIACCAADAIGSTISVTGQLPPSAPLNTTELQWVKVIGRFANVNGGVPTVVAESVIVIGSPKDPYI